MLLTGLFIVNMHNRKELKHITQIYSMELRDFQALMKELYFHRDSQRGIERTFMWITEELGELGRAIRKQNNSEMREEMADVLAWLFSLGNILDIDIETAVSSKYDSVCPRCHRIPCECPFQ